MPVTSRIVTLSVPRWVIGDDLPSVTFSATILPSTATLKLTRSGWADLTCQINSALRSGRTTSKSSVKAGLGIARLRRQRHRADEDLLELGIVVGQSGHGHRHPGKQRDGQQETG